MVYSHPWAQLCSNTSMADGWGLSYSRTRKKYLKPRHQNNFYHPHQSSCILLEAQVHVTPDWPSLQNQHGLPHRRHRSPVARTHQQLPRENSLLLASEREEKQPPTLLSQKKTNIQTTTKPTKKPQNNNKNKKLHKTNIHNKNKQKKRNGFIGYLGKTAQHFYARLPKSPGKPQSLHSLELSAPNSPLFTMSAAVSFSILVKM